MAEINLKKEINISIPDSAFEYARKVLEEREENKRRKKIKPTLEEQNKALIRDIKAIRVERNNLIEKLKELQFQIMNYDIHLVYYLFV